MLSQVATWALSPIMIVLFPRFLGVEDYGTWAFVSAYVGFFALAAGFGMSPLMTREVARDHSIVGLYVYNAVVMKLVLVTVFSALALTLAVILDYSNQTLLLIAIGCGGMYFTSINEMLAPRSTDWSAWARRRSGPSSRSTSRASVGSSSSPLVSIWSASWCS